MSYQKEYKNAPTDAEMLDFMQMLLDRKKYTGICVLRDSTDGKGFRLFETSYNAGVPSVRRAIHLAMDRFAIHPYSTDCE